VIAYVALGQKSLDTSDLNYKESYLLSVADFANYAKVVFAWPVWAVYGFAIATKGSKAHSHQSL